MRDLLEDWADEPLSLMGALLLVSLAGWLGAELLGGVLAPSFRNPLREVANWFGYACCVALLSTMIVGGMTADRPSDARAMMPTLSFLVGVFFLFCADWSVGAPLRDRLDQEILTGERPILWGRAGVVLVGIGIVLALGNFLIRTTKRHRYR